MYISDIYSDRFLSTTVFKIQIIYCTFIVNFVGNSKAILPACKYMYKIRCLLAATYPLLTLPFLIVAKDENYKKFKIYFCKFLRFIQYQAKVLLKSFHLIGNITGFRPVIQKLEHDHNSVQEGKDLCTCLDKLYFILSYTSALSYLFKRKYFDIVKRSDARLAEKIVSYEYNFSEISRVCTL